MKNFKKAVILMLSILVILAFANTSLARTISGGNSTNTSNTSNTDDENNTTNDVDNNTTGNNTSNAPLMTNNTPKTINSSNVSENLPNTGISSSELNLALVLLLALVFGMFSLVQYNKIVKKDNEK